MTLTLQVDAHTFFTESGEQVRNMPTYYVSGDKKTKNANFDDMPEVMLPAVSCSQKYPGVALGTAMDFTLLVVEREGKILFPHCTDIVHTCRRTFFMTLHANCQNTA